MKEYLDACRKILDEGTPIFNKRTGTICHTLANLTFIYDVGNNKFPLITTRKGYYKAAIAELLGYLRGYDNAAQFRSIGCNTWNANANDNKAWLANPNRKGEDDMGRVYGVQGREWLKPDGTTHDQLQKLVNNLTGGIDDRGEILTFYNPGEFELGCLRPCMHTHQFTLLDDTLHLTSFQRSNDLALGQVFNSVQCFVLLALMAQITGHKAGLATHHIVNAHIYDNQVEGVSQLLEREPYESPSLVINENIKTLADIETWVSTDDFTVVNYKHHDPITIPFFGVNMYPIAFIVAADANGGIGKDNKLLWKIPSDLANFAKVTKQKPVIMGRKTYESIGRRLPDRFNIVISSTNIEGVLTVRTPAEALERAENYWKNIPNTTVLREIMVIGGASIYKAFEDIVSKVYLTRIAEHAPADAWFDDSFLLGSDLPLDTWQVLEEQLVQADDSHPMYSYTVYQKTQQSFNF